MEGCFPMDVFFFHIYPTERMIIKYKNIEHVGEKERVNETRMRENNNNKKSLTLSTIIHKHLFVPLSKYPQDFLLAVLG